MNYNTFLKVFKSEHYKLSKNREIFGVLMFPILIVIFIFIYLIYDFNNSGGSELANNINPWKLILGRYTFLFYYLLYPVLVAIFCFACCDVEFNNNNYKLLFTLPVSRTKIFFCKALYIQITVFFSVVFAFLTFLFVGHLLGIIMPQIGYQNFDFKEVVFFIFLKLFIALSAISMIQLALSLFFNSFIYPLGFNVFMVVFSIVVGKKEFSDFIPYTSTYKSFYNLMNENIAFQRIDFSNICFILIFLIISWFLFLKKEV